MFGEDDLVKSHQERADIILNIIVVCFAILLARLWYLQVYHGKMFFNYSLENRLRKDVVRAPRGMIFSRNNVLLTHNVPRFDAIITPQYLEGDEETISYLAKILEMPSTSILKILKKYQGQAKYIPVVVKKNISRREVAIIETESSRLPGVSVETFISREYTDRDAGAHLLGYISEISQEKLPRFRERDKYDYKQGDFIGQGGIEQQYDLDIRGQDGYQFMEVDARGRARRHVTSDDLYSGIDNRAAQPGKNIRLTIDRDVQLAAYHALDGKDGAAVAVDVDSGEIIAMVSRPAYDPSNFSTGLTSNYWGQLVMDEKRPLRDRAIQDHFSPGSTFKPLTAIAALEEGIVNEKTQVVCNGVFHMGGRPFHCWKKEGHGVVDVIRAVRESCDIFFYMIGNKMDIDVLYKYATLFGLGQRTGIILPRETSGLIPNKEWKKKRTGVEWQRGETLSCVIGQSFVNLTPLQLTMFYATMANEGKLWRPHVVKEIFSNSGEVLKRFEPELIHQFKVSKKTMDLIKQGLFDVTNTQGGTAYSLKGSGLQMAAKTGTAQVIGFSADKIFNKCENQEYKFRNNGLFAAYAPIGNPKIAVGVVVEHGCHGGSAAGPVAKAMIAAYMNKYYPTYQKKIVAQEQAKMTWTQIQEDNLLNPVPMIQETETKDYYDEAGNLVRSYLLEKGAATPIAPVE
ncbi:MAG: penicillin-binding protein 2 [Bacteriovorax sp.]|jgi:penicillin-binding protein 2|nr:penicillin-binding protein 2 [Bacteriovorax sp.]